MSLTLTLAALMMTQSLTQEDLGYYTAGELEARCEGEQANPSTCFAYVSAVHDAVRAYELWLNIREFCIPEDTPQAELRRIFLDHLQTHADDRTAQASSVVIVALKRRFPCPATAPAQPASSGW